MAAQLRVQGQQQVVAPHCYSENTNSELFENWFRKSLVKAIPKGSYIIMDNASFHRKTRLKNLARRHGMKILFLPPYSPDFNPIEKTWANLKRKLRDTIKEFDSLEFAIFDCFC